MAFLPRGQKSYQDPGTPSQLALKFQLLATWRRERDHPIDIGECRVGAGEQTPATDWLRLGALTKRGVLAAVGFGRS